METEVTSAKRITTFIFIVTLIILAFIIIRPILIATLTGLILAYVFNPLYIRVLKIVKSRNFAASFVSVFIVILIIVPLWFILPIALQQAYDFFSYYQTIDVTALIKSILPTASEKLQIQLSLTLTNMVNTLTTSFSKVVLDFALNLPMYIIDIFILGFVFFYALRDYDRMLEFFKAVSPLSEHNEKMLIKHFKDMTDSVIYGQFIVGAVQGATAGLGFLLFGVDNALLLTILAIFFSVIPFIGPWIVWGPVNILMFINGNTSLAVFYLLYNLLIVSIIDNIVRTYLISRKTKVSPAVIVVGMFGGIFVFNLLGLIIGPLILAYLLSILESFKNKSIYDLFSSK